MRIMQPVRDRSWIAQVLFALLLLSTLVLVSACNGSPQIQQQTQLSKARFDQLLKHAQSIGVPAPLLAALSLTEQQLSHSSEPFHLFSAQPLDDYYHNLTLRYTQLTAQLQGLIPASTEQARMKALDDLQNLQTMLTQARAHHLPTGAVLQQKLQAQTLLPATQYPKDYSLIDSKFLSAQSMLIQLTAASTRMATLQQSINTLQAAHLDVTGLRSSYQNDVQMLGSVATIAAVQQLNMSLDAQYQQTLVNMTLAIPYLIKYKLATLDNELQLMQKYALDNTPYQQKLADDQAAVPARLDIASYQTFEQRANTDIATFMSFRLRGEARNLVQQFHQEAQTWGNAHVYYDDYNGWTYPLDNGYQQQGIGSDLDAQFAAATGPSDLQNVVDAVNNALFNLHMLEANYSATTPYNQLHKADIQLLDHYQLRQGQVLVVSLTEQVMRVYQNAALVIAFPVTTGRAELPSLPGAWPILSRLAPTVFKSDEPRSSPYWYPPTPIHYAMLYHAGGYFIHDSWWRYTYGPGTQFPHPDASGNQSFSGNGSHGCINMREDEAAWVYANTSYNTMLVVY